MEENDQIAEVLANSDPVSIGKWTFYADTLLLESADNRVKLEPKAAYLLYYLAENAGSPVSRAELIDRVWSGMVVGDEALTGSINKLRNAFGDDSHHPPPRRTRTILLRPWLRASQRGSPGDPDPTSAPAFTRRLSTCR